MIAGAALLARVAALLKEMVAARQFGVGDEMDAFVVAMLVPFYLINVIGGSLGVALVPAYVGAMRETQEHGCRALLWGVAVRTAGAALLLAAILAMSAGSIVPYLAPEFSPEKRALVGELLIILALIVPLSTLSHALTAALNARRSFGHPGLVAAVVPIAIIVQLLLFPGLGVRGMAAATVVGYGLELLLLERLLAAGGAALRPAVEAGAIVQFRRQVWRQYLPAFSGSLLMCSAVVIDQVMAGWLGSGEASALSYGQRVVGVAISLAAMGIGTAVLPFFSQLVAEGEWRKLNEAVRRYSSWLILLILPGVVLLVLLSEMIVRLIFEGGNFTAEDTVHVAAIQSVFALQIPFYVISILYVRTLSALCRNDVMMAANVISFALNIALNIWFMRLWGAQGIALSTVAVYAFAAIFFGTILSRTLREKLAQTGAV